MKKTLLFVAAIAVSFIAHGTVYNFGSTTGSITANKVTIANLTTAAAGVTDSMLVNYDYTAAPVTVPVTPAYIGTLSISSIPNVQFSYSNSGNKSSFFRIYPYALYTSGKGVTVTISNVTVGDSLVIATQAKGSTADTWTVTGANTTSSLSIAGAPAAPAVNPVSYLRLLATDATIVLKETNGGFRIISLNWFNINATSVKSLLADKGISFNGTEITNTKGLDIEVYSVLGKKVANAKTSISTTNFQKGVYIVRAAGSTDSLKICI